MVTWNHLNVVFVIYKSYVLTCVIIMLTHQCKLSILFSSTDTSFWNVDCWYIAVGFSMTYRKPFNCFKCIYKMYFTLPAVVVLFDSAVTVGRKCWLCWCQKWCQWIYNLIKKIIFLQKLQVFLNSYFPNARDLILSVSWQKSIES